MQAKDKLAMDLKDKMKSADNKLLEKLKAIVAGSGGSSGSGEGGVTS